MIWLRRHSFKRSPYKDGILIAAQVIAVLAFLLSLSGMPGAVIALFTVMLFLSTCCCSVNKCGLITSGVFGILTTLVLVLFAVAIPMDLKTNEAEFRARFGDASYEAVLPQLKIRVTLMISGAVLWTVASILIFIFACTRYERVVRSYEPVAAEVV